ncbi:MAG: TetR/AcrR family transcriptional regulator, partial [Desulfobacteraceae bacterium]|nr:TetR/AcrR family transcriptional regulator [Desulfobacteraceae bacterium]
EIAKAANVSDRTIYDYFSNKEALLFAIPAEITKSLFEALEFHLELIRGSANKLRSIIYLFLNAYWKNPDFTAVLMLHLKHNKKFLEAEGRQVIKDGIRHISEIIEQGIASGEFKKDINPYLIRSMILGTIEHLVTNWVMTGRPDNLVEFVDPLIDTIILGIVNTEDTQDHWSHHRPQLSKDE